MDKKTWLLLLLPPIALLLFLGIKQQYEKQPDPAQFFSGNIVAIGNPLANRWPIKEFVYARNIWDMQKYADKIYIGSGNSANRGPVPNAGPIDIWSYTPKTNQFTREGIVNDEQIDRFNIINGKLVIPGHDAAAPDNWEFGNYYIREATNDWKKYRRIPNGIHVYDMIEHDGKLFAALGTLDWYAGIAISENNGETWKTHPVGFYRFYSLFKFHGELYASGIFYSPARIEQLQARFPKHKQHLSVGLYKYQNKQISPVNIDIDTLFPGWEKRSAKLRLPTSYKNALIYIGASPSNDHQYSTQHLYVMPSLGKSTELILPEQFSPMDILVHNDRLQVLATKKTTDQWNYQNAVYETQDLKNWTLLEAFKADTFARSFESMAGCFYYGMGTEVKKAKNKQWKKWAFSPLTGVILRSKSCNH